MERDTKGRFAKGNKEGRKFNGGSAAENGRKGSLASAASKRKKQDLTSALRILLEREYKNKKGEVATGYEIAVAALFKRIQQGDVKALKYASELLGEYRRNIDISTDGMAVRIEVSSQETAEALGRIIGENNADIQ